MNDIKIEMCMRLIRVFLLLLLKHNLKYMLNYPNNPTGQSYTKEELEALAGVARKYKVVIIADEIYGALSFDSHHSIAEYYPEGTIVTAGLSKWCGAGGCFEGTGGNSVLKTDVGSAT